jgi:hypothetical protein
VRERERWMDGCTSIDSPNKQTSSLPGSTINQPNPTQFQPNHQLTVTDAFLYPSNLSPKLLATSLAYARQSSPPRCARLLSITMVPSP